MRSRNIKPGFYKNEQLAECSIEARLLFPGLWMLADREGRMEYRPKRIKAEIFPFDNIEITPLIEELKNESLIIEYQVEGYQYLWIPGFKKHQAPHCKEKQSEIPASYEEKSTVQAQCEHGASTVQTQDLPGNSNAEHPLIPDSCILNPESCILTPEVKDSEPKKVRTKSFTVPSLEEVSAYCQERSNDIDPEYFIDYHQARGWRLKTGAVRCWKAVVRTWEKNNFNGRNGPSSNQGPRAITVRDALVIQGEQIARALNEDDKRRAERQRINPDGSEAGGLLLEHPV